MSDSFAVTVAAGASSSLLSKYTKLTSSIALTRQSIDSTENEISSLMSAIAELKESRQEMKQDLSKAMEDTNACLITKTRSSITTTTTDGATTTVSAGDNTASTNTYDRADEEEYNRLTKTEMELNHEIQMLEQDIKREKSEKEQQRLEFLSDCRDFRRMVKRSRITLEGLKFQTGSTYIEQQEVEDKMKVAREKKRESEVLLARTRQDVSRLKEEKQRKEKESMDRVQNLQQQRKHLEKVRGDVIEMEREIHNLEQSTKEFEEITDGYAKDAARRRANQHTNLNNRSSWNSNDSTRNSPVADSPYSYNPSQRQHQAISNPYTKHRNSDSRSQEAQRLLNAQHPHRAGRIRVDRQFTTSLSVGATVQTSENEWRRGTKRQSSDYSIYAAENVISDDKCENGSAGKRHRTDTESDLRSDVGSSDDDDDILTFVPFKDNL
mmetsp:Transcript_16186/g.30600  ORF Transcript_16186/g.30600 Transcript_16186/m.30600 type:complete len:438 (+) Transcript_16186:150-1463(+)